MPLLSPNIVQSHLNTTSCPHPALDARPRTCFKCKTTGLLDVVTTPPPEPVPAVAVAIATATTITVPPASLRNGVLFSKFPNPSPILAVLPDTSLPSPAASSSPSSRHYPAARRTRTLSSLALLCSPSETSLVLDRASPAPPLKDTLLPT